METQREAELFQTMAIISLNMGNLNMEMSNLKNILATREKDKAILQEDLDKEKDFQMGYKHNVEIQKKNIVEVKQKIKMLIKKLQDENEELKGSTMQLKSQDEELQDLRREVEIQETIERKWTKALFLHKHQQEALGSQVKTLIEEKKKKENVLKNLKLVNMKNAFLLQFKKLERKTIEVERENLMEEKKCQNNLQYLQAQLEITKEHKKIMDPIGVKKRLKDYE